MIKAVLLFIASAILSSCGIIQGFEDRMDHLSREVESTNRKLDDTKDGQALGAALELMRDKGTSPNIRAAAAETVFTKAKEGRIFKYIGAPAPLNRLFVPVPVAPGRMVTVLNVSYVGNDPDEKLAVAPINEDLHRIQKIASMSLLKQLSVESKTPGLSAERLNELRQLFPRISSVALAVVGGLSMEDLALTLQGKPRAITDEDRKAQRAYVGSLLKEVAASLSIPESQLEGLDQAIEARLGVR